MILAAKAFNAWAEASGISSQYLSLDTARWPTSGRHILAQHDAARVVVYQAFSPTIARIAFGCLASSTVASIGPGIRYGSPSTIFV